MWAVGYPADDATIASFATQASDTVAPCMSDDAWFLPFNWEASKDDIFVIDQAGQVFYYLNAGARSLGTPANLDELDAVVRALVTGG